MTVQWITAPKALALIEEFSDGLVGERAILGRARAGQLKATARLMNIEGDSRANATLRPEFWIWDSDSAPEQHWQVGDFAAYHDGLRHDAIGVAFDMGDVREMLPAEQRALAARSSSVAGDARWMSSNDSRAFVYTVVGTPPTSAGRVLLDHYLTPTP